VSQPRDQGNPFKSAALEEAEHRHQTLKR